MKRLEVAISRLAARQHGVVTRTQALELGLTSSMVSRRVAEGHWERLYPGVYRLPGARPTWRAALLAACFAWGPDATASHASAAALRNLVGFVPGAMEITVPYGRDRGAPGVVHRTELAGVDVEVVDAIPATTVARTLLDVAGSYAEDVVEAALDDALYRGLVSRARLRWRLDQLAANGRAGVAVLRDLLKAREGMVSVPQSLFETRLLRLLKANGFPLPEVQHPIKDHGRFIARVDFAYPNAQLVIEADGRTSHSGRADFERDRQRSNALVALGWRILRITWEALTRAPATVLQMIGTALSVRA